MASGISFLAHENISALQWAVIETLASEGQTQSQLLASIVANCLQPLALGLIPTRESVAAAVHECCGNGLVTRMDHTILLQLQGWFRVHNIVVPESLFPEMDDYCLTEAGYSLYRRVQARRGLHRSSSPRASICEAAFMEYTFLQRAECQRLHNELVRFGHTIVGTSQVGRWCRRWWDTYDEGSRLVVQIDCRKRATVAAARPSLESSRTEHEAQVLSALKGCGFDSVQSQLLLLLWNSCPCQRRWRSEAMRRLAKESTKCDLSAEIERRATELQRTGLVTVLSTEFLRMLRYECLQGQRLDSVEWPVVELEEGAVDLTPVGGRRIRDAVSSTCPNAWAAMARGERLCGERRLRVYSSVSEAQSFVANVIASGEEVLVSGPVFEPRWRSRWWEWTEEVYLVTTESRIKSPDGG